MAAKPYNGGPLDASDGSNRLLRVFPPHDGVIRCRLSVGNLYTSTLKALSYVLGSQHASFQIKQNGEPWTVRKSLFENLKKARVDYADQPPRIDVLCINQDSIFGRK